MATYGPGDSSLDHADNEHILLADYLAGIRVLTGALDELGRCLPVAAGAGAAGGDRVTAVGAADRRQPVVWPSAPPTVRERIVEMCSSRAAATWAAACRWWRSCWCCTSMCCGWIRPSRRIRPGTCCCSARDTARFACTRCSPSAGFFPAEPAGRLRPAGQGVHGAPEPGAARRGDAVRRARARPADRGRGGAGSPAGRQPPPAGGGAR